MADSNADPQASAGTASETFDQMGRSALRLESSANGFARAMANAFTQATTGGKRFDDVLKALALRLSNLAVQAAFKPLAQGLLSGLSGLFGGATSTGSAGAATAANAGAGGAAQAFAAGGVIAAPTYFPLGRGTGLAGEAGPEAILPLARGSDGRLGVAAAGSAPSATVTINIATPDAASFRRSETYVTGLVARAVARGQRGL
jgi:lambda family phage tail tape measure protein